MGGTRAAREWRRIGTIVTTERVSSDAQHASEAVGGAAGGCRSSIQGECEGRPARWALGSPPVGPGAIEILGTLGRSTPGRREVDREVAGVRNEGRSDIRS